MNQCDGCRRGLPIVDGVHQGTGWDMIGCTKELYTGDSDMQTVTIDVAKARVYAKCKLTHEEYFGGVIFTPTQNVKIGEVLLAVFGDYKCGVPMTSSGTWGFKQWAKWIQQDERW